MGAIAGAVEAGGGIGGEGVGDEAFGCEFGGVDIAARETCAAEIEFAGDAGGHGLEMAIEDVSGVIGERLADGEDGGVEIGSGGDVEGSVYASFGGAIHVYDFGVRERFLNARDQRAGERFAAEREALEVQGFGRRCRVQNGIEERRDGVDVSDLAFGEERPEIRRGRGF